MTLRELVAEREKYLAERALCEAEVSRVNAILVDKLPAAEYREVVKRRAELVARLRTEEAKAYYIKAEIRKLRLRSR